MVMLIPGVMDMFAERSVTSPANRVTLKHLPAPGLPIRRKLLTAITALPWFRFMARDLARANMRASSYPAQFRSAGHHALNFKVGGIGACLAHSSAIPSTPYSRLRVKLRSNTSNTGPDNWSVRSLRYVSTRAPK